jgi:hypothetical protein
MVVYPEKTQPHKEPTEIGLRPWHHRSDCFVCRKQEGLEPPPAGGHIVARCQHDITAGVSMRALPSIDFIDFYICRLDRDLSSPRHCVASVNYQIHQHLLNLTGVHHDCRRVCLESRRIKAVLCCARAIHRR